MITVLDWSHGTYWSRLGGIGYGKVEVGGLLLYLCLLTKKPAKQFCLVTIWMLLWHSIVADVVSYWPISPRRVGFKHLIRLQCETLSLLDWTLQWTVWEVPDKKQTVNRTLGSAKSIDNRLKQMLNHNVTATPYNAWYHKTNTKSQIQSCSSGMYRSRRRRTSDSSMGNQFAWTVPWCSF